MPPPTVTTVNEGCLHCSAADPRNNWAGMGRYGMGYACSSKPIALAWRRSNDSISKAVCT